MKRSELKNYIKETILNKLDEASVEEAVNIDLNDPNSADKAAKVQKQNPDTDVNLVDMSESVKKKG